MLSFDISLAAYCLVGATALFAVAFLMLTLGKLRRVLRRHSTSQKLSMPADDKFPSVSVIVHDGGQAHNLTTLLPNIPDQDYPEPPEVIVVNSGAKSATEQVIAQLEQRYSNLYMTYLPEKSRSLSRRKLAITLGVKAARYEMVMLAAAIPFMIKWRKVATILRCSKLMLTVPWFTTWHLFYSLYYKLRCKRHKHENFTFRASL